MITPTSMVMATFMAAAYGLQDGIADGVDLPRYRQPEKKPQSPEAAQAKLDAAEAKRQRKAAKRMAERVEGE
ncbi:hypothetical protein [Pseudomonas sp.]|uniref:hypothetical protein n=1 Tax=Pseudomonas sp. TaxID=306 RepID=UPI0033406D38